MVSAYLELPPRGLADVLGQRFHFGDPVIVPEGGTGRIIAFGGEPFDRAMIQLEGGTRTVVPLLRLRRPADAPAGARR